MKKPTEQQIDQILKSTESELSNFENAVRPALNSQLSEQIHKIFEFIFEPKTFAISLAISLLIFYVFFFSALITGQELRPEFIISLTLITYPILYAIKFTKNKIR